jgi:glutamate-1-semialdehyde 2,1-aminomutase
MMAPEGDIYQAGTLSGNPLAMSAGLATLRILKREGIYPLLEKKGELFFSGLEGAARAAGVDVVVNRIGSMGSFFFSAEPVKDFAAAKRGDHRLFPKYYKSMLDQGIYVAPSPFEASFLSTAHGEEMIRKTIACAEVAFSAL